MMPILANRINSKSDSLPRDLGVKIEEEEGGNLVPLGIAQQIGKENTDTFK